MLTTLCKPIDVLLKSSSLMFPWKHWLRDTSRGYMLCISSTCPLCFPTLNHYSLCLHSASETSGDNSDPNPLCPLFTGAESRPAIDIPTTAHLQLGQVIDGETLTRGRTVTGRFWCAVPPFHDETKHWRSRASGPKEGAQPCRKWTAPPVLQE